MLIEKIIFGAGCFWGVQSTFSQINGVTKTTCGYSGGHVSHPSYEMVCTGETGHAEVVQVEYDPEKVSINELLDIFWQCHDPTTKNRQGVDVGTQYRSAIYFLLRNRKQQPNYPETNTNSADAGRCLLSQRFCLSFNFILRKIIINTILKNAVTEFTVNFGLILINGGRV